MLNRFIRKLPISLRIFTFSFLFLFTVSAYSQNNISILLGPSISTLSGDYIQYASGAEWGFAAFISLDKDLGTRWSFVTGINIIQKGGKNVTLSTIPDTAYGYKFMYLELPLLMRYKFPFAGGKWYAAPYAGVSIGGNLSGNYKLASSFEFEEDPIDENTPGGKIESLEFGVPIGINFWRLFPGGSRFMFDAHYEIGLTNVFEGAQEVGEKAYNRVLVFMFGFSVPLQ